MKSSENKTKFKLLKQREFIAFAALVLIFVFFSLGSENFFTMFNIMNIFRQASINAIIAVGMTFVIISGGIDLSVGATVSLSGVMAAIVMGNWGMNSVVGVLCGLTVGIAIGFVNGFVITKGGVPPIIATVATMTIASGLALVLTGGRSVTNLPDSFSVIGRGNIGILPIPVFIILITYVLGHILLTKTRFGATVFGIGGNEEAARLAGISVEWVKIRVYMFCGAMSAISGLIMASRLNSGQPLAGDGLDLNAIAAVVIGGASVNGGVGGVVGSLIGALLMSVLTNGFDLIGMGRYYQMIFTGIVLILAVTLQKKTR